MHEFLVDKFHSCKDKVKPDLCDFLFDVQIVEPTPNKLLFNHLRISESHQVKYPSLDVQESLGVGSRSSLSKEFESQLIPPRPESFIVGRGASDVEMASVHTSNNNLLQDD